MKKTLLAVDDEKTMLKLMQHFFKEKFEVVVVENGREALNWLQAGNQPEAIVADVNMPELNGYEFIDHVRASAFFRNIPYYFFIMNYAVFAGFFRWLKGSQSAKWERAKRG